MLELLHAVLTSFLLSAGMGCSADQPVAGKDEPVDSEKGVDIGSMPSYLALPRGQSKAGTDLSDDDQPPSLPIQTFYCEPTVWVGTSFAALPALHIEVAFSTPGRSP